MTRTSKRRHGRPDPWTVAAAHARWAAEARAAARDDAPEARADFRGLLIAALAPVTPRQWEQAGAVADVYWRLGLAARRDDAAVAAAVRWADLRGWFDAVGAAYRLHDGHGRVPAGTPVPPAAALLLWEDAVGIARAAAGSPPARRAGRTPPTTPRATLARFCAAAAVPPAAAAGLRSYRGWTAGRVRSAYAYLARSAGVPVVRVETAASIRLLRRLLVQAAVPEASDRWIDVAAARKHDAGGETGDPCARFERCLGLVAESVLDCYGVTRAGEAAEAADRLRRGRSSHRTAPGSNATGPSDDTVGAGRPKRPGRP